MLLFIVAVHCYRALATFTNLHQVIGILLTLYPSQLPGEYTAHCYRSPDVLITHISVHSPDLYLFNV